MNDKEIKQLAVDIFENRVFGTWCMHRNDACFVGSVFLPIALGAEVGKDVEHVYEYLSEAGTMGINGYPTFFSCRLLRKVDWEKLKPLLTKLKEAKDKVLMEDIPDEAEQSSGTTVQGSDV